MGKDQLTHYASRAINTLFLYNVVGTSYGVLLGVLILSLQDLIALYIPNFGLIQWYGFIVFGILLFNIKPMIKKKYLDPDIERKLVYIRQTIKEGNLTKTEERVMWRTLANSIITEYGNTPNNNNDDDLHNPTPE